MDPESQFYPYIDTKHGGQYDPMDYINYCLHGCNQDPTPLHSAWDSVWDPNSP